MHAKKRLRSFLNLRDQRMYDSLLKFSRQEALAEQEKRKMDAWINAYEFRENLFRELLKIIEHEKKVKSATGLELTAHLDELKHIFPKQFENVVEEIKESTLSLVISMALISYRNHIIHQMVFGYKWLRIFASLLRLLIIVFLLRLFIKVVSG